MSIEIPGDNEGSRDSTTSNQSSGSGSTTSFNSGETSTPATTTPDTSYTSIESTKSLASDPASPRVIHPTRQRSSSLLKLNRTPSASRLRSGSRTSSSQPETPIPPLPGQEGLNSPKSILAKSSSMSLVEVEDKTPTQPILHRAKSVQFAPLPELAPRKRKSTVPLGIAARSQLMNRRRRTYGSAASTFEDPNSDEDDATAAARKKDRYVADGGGMWTKEEAQEHLTRQLRSKEKEREKMLKRQQKELEREAARNTANAEPDDPLVMFGRMMKDAWRKVGKKDKGKAVSDPQTRTQAEVEVEANPSGTMPDPSSVLSGSNCDVVQDGQLDGLTNSENGLSQEKEKLGEVEAEADLETDEVDVSKINPLRSGSPPPPPSETSSTDTDPEVDEDGDPDSSDTDSLSTMTSPTAMSPTTPTNSDFTSAEYSGVRHLGQDDAALSLAKDSDAHCMPSSDRLTPLSPVLAI